MKFKELFNHFKEMKHYFIASTLVFVVGLALGWRNADQFQYFLQHQLKGLESIANYVKQKENTHLWLFLLIFVNNAYKAVLFIYLGLFFSVFPLAILLINGMILGYVISEQVTDQRWMMIVKGILPHGFIEIPAIIIACAYGVRLGVLVAKGMLTLFFPSRRNSVKTELKRVLKLTKPLIVTLVVLLLIAAVIESTVTYWLVRT